MSKKSYSTLNLYIRSFIFFVYSGVSIIFFSLGTLCTFPLPLSYRYGVIRTFLRAHLYTLKVICHIDYVIEGAENIPTNRNGILLCKHQSTWETFLLPTMFHDVAPIAKREITWVPFFGWGFWLARPILINRSNTSSAMQQIIKQGTECLKQGRWIMAFPEGTRMPPGVAGKYKLGGARLAAATGYPVLPIAHNAGHFWPRRKFLKIPGTIRVVFGPLIESQGREPEEILDLAKNWIEDTMVRIEGLVDKPTG